MEALSDCAVRRLRSQVRPFGVSPDGVRCWGFGFRVGYWPCLKGPFIQFAVLFWRVDLWFGTPSYGG